LPEEDEARAEVLYQYLQKLPSKAALFTGDDGTCEFIEKYYSLFSSICHCPSTNGRLRELADKTYMSQIAEAVGLLVPDNTIVAGVPAKIIRKID
jgi:hypothetical protein